MEALKYVHKTMVIVIHTLVDLSEVNGESQFVQVRLFHGKNWAVVQARIFLLDCSQTEELVYLLINECQMCCRYGELFYIRVFLRLRAENVGYSVHFPHIALRFCYCLMLSVKCGAELISLFYSYMSLFCNSFVYHFSFLSG